MAKGFSLYMVKAVTDGRANEVIDLAKLLISFHKQARSQQMIKPLFPFLKQRPVEFILECAALGLILRSLVKRQISDEIPYK